jgi:alkylation response protein AidB-like acyl-CoA dehydrogenase
MDNGAASTAPATLKTLPGDEVRQILWRFADRYDLQMLVQSARSVARGPVARLVAAGGRNGHDWTPAKGALLKAFDEAGVTAAYMDPDQGGFVAGPKNLALALLTFEIAWVDAGAATAAMAGNLALGPIHECGTPEQRARYMPLCVPPKPGEAREIWRGAFALTEPLPFVGVETGTLCGKVRVAEWKEGQEPVLQVEKRGRFITNIGYARFVTAAVDSDDPRIKGSCMVILEQDDPGTFDRGAATKKLVHQLSSTGDPVLSLRVPAGRIIGGYAVKDGTIVPRMSHGEVIEAVFRRTRVTVSLMTAAKLLSAVEPVLRYHRTRFRGGGSAPGTPRYDLGIQGKEDATHRLIDVWATGEAAASLGFAAARLFDELDPLEKTKDALLAKQGVEGPRARMRALMKVEKDALEWIALDRKGPAERGPRYDALAQDALVQFVLRDALANVLCPASKLWCCGVGTSAMREAVSLMGGYGITEDCPGFLMNKWIDGQLEATYEGPEAVQRRQLTITAVQPLFLAQFDVLTEAMRKAAAAPPDRGACVLAQAMALWRWTLGYLQAAKDPRGAALYHSARQGITFAMADALGWLLAAYHLIDDARELEAKGAAHPALAEGLEGLAGFYRDLGGVQSARAAGEAARICAELVYGYRTPQTSGSDCCAAAPELAEFERLRQAVDRCLAGARLAKDRAADALTRVMIPEALDYPI